MKNATVRVELDRRSLGKKDNRYRITILVSYKGTKKRYNTKCRLSAEEWERMNGKGLKNDYIRDTKIKLDELFAKAVEIVDKLDHTFTYGKFDNLFFSREPGLNPAVKETYEEKHCVYKGFDKYITFLKKQKRYGTKGTYENAKISLQKFWSKLVFDEITPDFLYDYEDWMVERGLSLTTVAIHARHIRSIYNLAIEEGLASKELYPFGMKSKMKYRIPSSRNVKKALKVEDIQRIIDTPYLTPQADFAKAIWLFSFYSNGMNPGDIFFLQYKDIRGNHILFDRCKTINTIRENLPVIKVYLLDEIKNIIEKYGNKPCLPDTYIFSRIDDSLSDEEKYKMKCNFVSAVSQGMKRIAKHLQLDTNLGTNVARHSFATMLKHLGVPIEEISEYLGHCDIKTTMYYLDSFTDDHVKTMATKLSDYVKGA